MNGLFVTGTDTDCGKTLISVALMYCLQQAGLQIAGMKPVAAGAVGGQQNEDALMLQQQASRSAAYELVNPYLFEPAIAPHLAAARTGAEINLELITDAYQQLSRQADITIVEGAGGWRVPLQDDLDISDVPRRLGLPVVLVVGMKLGCINHARLAAEVIQADGVNLLGWIGCQVDAGMAELQGNVDSLKQYLSVPCLGIVPYLERATAAQAAEYIDGAQLLKLLASRNK